MTWHVYFDNLPEVRYHVCDQHRAIGQSIECDDTRPDGDCEHVQTRPCTCAAPWPCDHCLDTQPDAAG